MRHPGPAIAPVPFIALAAVLALAACSAVPPSPVSPRSSPSPAATPPPTATPVPSDCPLQPETGRLPSDRLTDVLITSADGADVVTFVFGDPSSSAPPQGASEGSIAIAEPPFVGGASGQPLEVDGRRVLEIRFSGMTLGDDDESPTYEGADRLRPDLPALRSVVLREAFEGIVSWYVGFDGPGCVSLAAGADSVSVVILHGPG